MTLLYNTLVRIEIDSRNIPIHTIMSSVTKQYEKNKIQKVWVKNKLKNKIFLSCIEINEV